MLRCLQRMQGISHGLLHLLHPIPLSSSCSISRGTSIIWYDYYKSYDVKVLATALEAGHGQAVILLGKCLSGWTQIPTNHSTHPSPSHPQIRCADHSLKGYSGEVRGVMC